MAGKRKRGEGTVRLRKDGRWEGRVVVGYDEAGNPKTKNVLAKTKKECVEKLEKLKEQCGNHRPTQVRPVICPLNRYTYSTRIFPSHDSGLPPSWAMRAGSTTT